VAVFPPTVRAHENDIRDPSRPAMLKRIVEHDHITPGPHCLVGAGETIGRDDDRHARVEGTMDERLVLSVSPQDDGGLRAGTLQTIGEVRSERRFACASHREIPDAQRGNSRWLHGADA
jgi:hypothetical protein